MKLAEHQLGALNALVGAILPGNKFYAAKLGEVGSFASLADFAERVPFTTKEEVAADHEEFPPYGTTHTHPLELYHRFHQTSGTRGTPLIWMDDPESWEWVLGNWEAVWRGAGVKAGDCALFPFSFGPFLGFWAGFEAAARMGVRAVPGGGMSSEDRLGLLERCGANVLCCTPTYALRLAEVGEAMGNAVAGLGVKTIVVCGEPGGSIPAVRERIETAWQAKVVDHHGMTEIGPVTVSHEENADWLRLLHFSYYAEVIDPETQAPVALGEVGELVLTTLGRYGAPLLRYRTGDLVTPVVVPGEDPDAFVLEGGIIGRADDMVVVRGVNIYPSAVDAVVRACEGIGEYQVEVDQRAALPELLIRVEGGETKGLETALRQAFGLRIPVETVAVGTLPVFEVKAKRWVEKR